MNAFWKQLAARAAPYAIVALMAGGWFALYTQHQRALGALHYQLAASVQATASAAHRADSLQRVDAQLRHQLRADSAIASQQRTTLALALARAKAALEGAGATVAARDTGTAPGPDTAATGVSSALAGLIQASEADTAASGQQIRACYAVLRNCDALHAADSLQIRGLRQQLRIVRQQEPSATRVWLERLGWGIGGVELGCALVTHRICLPVPWH